MKYIVSPTNKQHNKIFITLSLLLFIIQHSLLLLYIDFTQVKKKLTGRRGIDLKRELHCIISHEYKKIEHNSLSPIMKFCKHLQQMMNLSDPEWVPYYTNYKMLKKLIKELKQPTGTSTIPTTTTTKEHQHQHHHDSEFKSSEYEPEYDPIHEPPQQEVPLLIVINDSSINDDDYQKKVKNITIDEEQRRRHILVDDILNQHNTHKRLVVVPPPPPPPLVRPVQHEEIQEQQYEQQQETGETVTEQRIHRNNNTNRTPTPPTTPTNTRNQNIGESSGTKNDSKNSSGSSSSGSSTSTSTSTQKTANTTITTTATTATTNVMTTKQSNINTSAAAATIINEIDVVDPSNESIKSVLPIIQNTVPSTPPTPPTTTTPSTSNTNQNNKSISNVSTVAVAVIASSVDMASSSSSLSPLHKKQCCKQQQQIDDADNEQQQQQQQQEQQCQKCQQPSHDEGGISTTITNKNNVSVPVHNNEPLLLYNTIKNNTMEQYFFRCLHMEVKKVSHFYHLMIQELYIRYERIYQSTLRINTTSTTTTTTTKNDDNNDVTYRTTIPNSNKRKQKGKKQLSIPKNTLETTNVSKTSSTKQEVDSNVAQDILDFVTATTTTTNTATTTTATMESDNDTTNTQQQQKLNQQQQQYVIPMLLISIYKLSRDLLLLESYSIMAFTSFSKILKKHDKVTGYDTKYNFMTKVVIPSNFVQTNTSTYINHTNTNSMNQHRIRGDQHIQEEVNDVSVNRTKVATKATRPSERIGRREIRQNPQELPSLQTMIEQCYHWYDTISEQYEQNEIMNTTATTIIQPPQPQQQYQQQQQQQPKPLNYDEMLFLNMIQQLNQNYR